VLRDVLISGVEKMNRKGNLTGAGDVLSVREVQQILGIGRNAAYELIASGRLPSIRITARRIVVTKRALEAFLGLPSKSTGVGTPGGYNLGVP
jgi:excisionase family DNA binding protein